LEQRRLNMESGSSKAMALEVHHEAMATHLGAEEAQHGTRKIERNVVVHPGAMEAFLELWQLTLEPRL
jgi:hypothetical protein